jgi:hypothetical protein
VSAIASERLRCGRHDQQRKQVARQIVGWAIHEKLRHLAPAMVCLLSPLNLKFLVERVRFRCPPMRPAESRNQQQRPLPWTAACEIHAGDG